MTPIYHALVLNLHQPSGNLEHLLEQNEWEAKEILYAIDRIPRWLWNYEDIARIHLALSGTLLETLSNPDFQRRAYGTVDCGSLLWYLQNEKIIDVLGGAYYHPVLPLIPSDDREEHLNRWLGIGRHLFWRTRFQGFWPPEMGFSMELIPLLAKYGYRYVLVDSDYIEPVTPMRWDEIRYRPHKAQYNGEEIIVVVRDRELSDAQEAGMDYGWFKHEVMDRTKGCDFSPLVTTCTDGENGGWFRNVSSKGNFWGFFYDELIREARNDLSPIQPAFIHDYLDQHGCHGEVRVSTGAWNTGLHHGHDFMQWTGSDAQKDALQRVNEASREIHDAQRKIEKSHVQDFKILELIEKAVWHLLRAETSCNFYWGEEWLHRCNQDIDISQEHIRKLYTQWPNYIK